MKLNLKCMPPFALALAGGIIFAFPARAVTYWASGADANGGWFDFGQMGATSCGRATSASLIYWWQRESKLENPVHETVDEIFSQIEKKFTDSGDPTTGGTHVITAVEWYMKTFYPEVNLKENFWRSHMFFNPTYGGGYGNAREASGLFRDCLSKGLLIALDTGSHALTVWGADFDDETGLISKIYVTDPALLSSENTLEEWTVSSYAMGDPDNRWLVFKGTGYNLDGSTYTANMDVRWLHTLTPIPEPSSAFLLGAAGLLAACARRRRRSRAK